LEDLKLELINIAKKHYEDVQQYQDAARDFSEIFPPNPGYHCRFCPFQSICEFSAQPSQAQSLPIIKTNSR
ncbi:hypothetical protein WDZ92_25600, partial [Nostoc sp. NIES-2111]